MAETPDDKAAQQYEARAPGWVIRCMRCGFTEPFGKYGVRWGAYSYKKCTLGWCSRCRRLCCHAIEKARPPRPDKAPTS